MKNAEIEQALKLAIREASQWYAKINAESFSEEQKKDWQNWLSDSALNQQAWQQVEAVQSGFRKVPGHVVAPALQQSELSRRELLRKLSAFALFAPAIWASYRFAPWAEWQAEYSTAVGEQRRFSLMDGTLLALDTNSAADVLFDHEQRLVQLHQGEIFIKTAPDKASVSRPFQVKTPHGLVVALGTRFTVRVEGDKSRVTVLDKAVRIFPNGVTAALIETGQSVAFSQNAMGDVTGADISAGSWLNGSLIVVDMPLGKMVTELARYRHGILDVDPAIKHIKVSGAFPLQNTDLALGALENSFPVTQRRLTKYWVKIIPTEK